MTVNVVDMILETQETEDTTRREGTMRMKTGATANVIEAMTIVNESGKGTQEAEVGVENQKRRGMCLR
jgi:hypothetical protein